MFAWIQEKEAQGGLENWLPCRGQERGVLWKLGDKNLIEEWTVKGWPLVIRRGFYNGDWEKVVMWQGFGGGDGESLLLGTEECLTAFQDNQVAH